MENGLLRAMKVKNRIIIQVIFFIFFYNVKSQSFYNVNPCLAKQNNFILVDRNEIDGFGVNFKRRFFENRVSIDSVKYGRLEKELRKSSLKKIILEKSNFKSSRLKFTLFKEKENYNYTFYIISSRIDIDTISNYQEFEFFKKENEGFPLFFTNRDCCLKFSLRNNNNRLDYDSENYYNFRDRIITLPRGDYNLLINESNTILHIK